MPRNHFPCNHQSQVQIQIRNKYCTLLGCCIIYVTELSILGLYISYAYSSMCTTHITYMSHMCDSCLCVPEILLCARPSPTLFDFDFSFQAYQIKTLHGGILSTCLCKVQQSVGGWVCCIECQLSLCVDSIKIKQKGASKERGDGVRRHIF